MLPPRSSWPRYWWFTHALVLACGGFLWLQFHLRLGEIGAGRALGLFLEAILLGFVLAPLFHSAIARSQSARAERWRWAALVAIGLILTLPYARPERVGAGDAQDYAEHLADFISQVQDGVFPVLVGQSRFAFNGDFNPLRTAPYFQYLGGALYALSFGTLGPFALQNLEIILSLLAGGFGAYLCLLRLAPRRGWFCLLLAALYVSSPGVLALAYSGDMIPSWLTLPYLPLYGYLLVGLGERGITGRRLSALAIVMAVLWMAHAPIAMWLSFLAIPVIVVRLALAARVSWRRSLLWGGGALLIFGLLAGYEFVSVISLQLPGIPPHAVLYPMRSVREILDESWRGFLRPVSANASDLLNDLQLSPGLWLCLILGFLGWRKGGWGLRILMLAALGLLTLLLPFPELVGRTWAAMPGWVGRITDQWPSQRFFPILSALAPFAALLACERAWPRRPRIRTGVIGVLACCCLWSGVEARKFLQRGYRVAAPPELSRQLITGQSTVLSVYSYAMVAALPRYYSYGPVKPDLQLHLLDAESLEIADTNQKALLEGRVAAEETQIRAFTPVAGGAVLQPDLMLPPGRSYLLLFDFKGAPNPGTLVISGRDFWREYPLPESGGDRAFGVGGNHSAAIGLHVPEGTNPEAVSLRYVAAPGKADRPVFADLKVVSYLSANLPFHLLSLVPYRVLARAPRGGWMETPRIFIPGYHAVIDGNSVAAERSPDGLVMLRVPPGQSEMELRYEGPPVLRAAFWMSAGAWLILVAAWLGRAWFPQGVYPSALVLSGRRQYHRVTQQLRRFPLPVALAGLYLAVVLLGYGNFRRAEETSEAKNQRVFPVHFPTGQAGETVELAALENPIVTGRLLATYLDGSHVRLQFVEFNGRRSSTGPIFVNFLAEQVIECTQRPAGQRSLFFNHQLIWRSDARKLPVGGASSEQNGAAQGGDAAP